MRLLLTEHKKIDIFELQIPGAPYEQNITDPKVRVIFEDGKFSECQYHFNGSYTLEMWKILDELAGFISRKQDEFKNTSSMAGKS